jgi:hypothetical protein
MSKSKKEWPPKRKTAPKTIEILTLAVNTTLDFWCEAEPFKTQR